jgi:hypothetical protein
MNVPIVYELSKNLVSMPIIIHIDLKYVAIVSLIIIMFALIIKQIEQNNILIKKIDLLERNQEIYILQNEKIQENEEDLKETCLIQTQKNKILIKMINELDHNLGNLERKQQKKKVIINCK